MKVRALIPIALALAGCHREREAAPSAMPSTTTAAAAKTATATSSTETPANAATPPAEVAPRTIDHGDGLIVEITKDGYGAPSKIGDEISVAYTARTKEGDQVVASSHDAPVPLRLKLGEKGVLPGLSRALEGLRAGTVARIEIPPALAYGKEGNPGANVPADETLVFDVEILSLR